ncbi:MAG: hypothetical protein KIT83_07470 [Bryobacterales bacterium]|nr:hypothetical protein [Bryobacterales bacterium]
MKSLYRLSAIALLLTSGAFASFINGGFESGDLTGWNSLGSASVSGPVDYIDEGAGILSPDSGNFSARLISQGATAEQIATQMGITLEELQATNLDPDTGDPTTATVGSLIWQTVTVNAGDVLQFRWNFVERDYMPYNDWAFYGIALNGDPAQVTTFASLFTVGPDGGATINGWTTLTVNIQQSGTYTFYFGVVNAFDEELDSDLWIDGAYAGDDPPAPTGEIPEPGTFVLLASGLGLLAAKYRSRKAA